MSRAKNSKTKKVPTTISQYEEMETEAFGGHFFEIQSGCVDPLDSFFQKISEQPNQRHMALITLQSDDKE
ncbi:hypothetical protein [Bdellovibrio svalbardensis]|uniref:Uncharacterized protein n=1 Tax=Bdellovibrio svalbardensis TaxID=2972972 RepID=A0ABT6DIT4_9BACT|nr:hypothetical protein [Bdellovibrio svalbardensis]MDG0815776.1 hypothetical protein [Bdellovibrio svalbardensis]